MGSVKEYFSSLGSGIVSLVKGLQVTGKEFVTPKITERYPEDRDVRHVPERFRATLQFKYDDEGRHRCVACGICERNCPNGTITVETKTVETPDGKKKRKLDKYLYDLGSCTFCQLCVTTCPHDAIEFNNDFEQAVFTRSKLVKQLNNRPEVPDPEPTPEEIAKAKAAREAALAAAKAKAAAAQPASAPAMPSDEELERQAMEKAGGDPEKAARIKEALIKAAKLKAEREAAKAAAAPAEAAPAAAAPQQSAAEKAMAAAADDPEKAARIKAALEKAAKLKAEREAAKAAANNENKEKE